MFSLDLLEDAFNICSKHEPGQMEMNTTVTYETNTIMNESITLDLNRTYKTDPATEYWQ